MDQVKTGKFIAKLRREANLTQEALGARLGVTNKTISRWENGNYMPDIEMLQLLGRELGVSINELLAGEQLEEEAFRQLADRNLVSVAKESVFSLSDRKAYWTQKWREDHRALLALLILIVLLAVLLPFLLSKRDFAIAAPIIGMIAYAWQNNRMMAYVEEHLFEGPRQDP
ncbi:MAG: helix-turn-helix transcriptional regulator [Clostridia bacterium]|nr:helix-turn-helix transcriptional regulator [Clostridia bacterium]